ncbi:MAG: RibD family protein [candidate division WOR-3 bacterium]|nr:MAG: RibD family protein [candidate division WOR-3 bacterium]
MNVIDSIIASLPIHAHERRPYIAVAYAQSIDGSITSYRGTKLEMSSPESRVLSHQLRSRFDAVLVGIGTVLTDNPRLTVRLIEGRNPQTVVVDSQLSIPLDAQLLKNERLPWIFTTDRADPKKRKTLEDMGTRIIRVRTDDQEKIDLHYVMRELLFLGIKTLLIEGGAHIINSLFQEKLIDAMVLYVAPVFVGGVHVIEHPLVEKGEESVRKKLPELDIKGNARLGNDIVIWGIMGHE